MLWSTVRYHQSHRHGSRGEEGGGGRTNVFSLGEDVAESLDKVREIIAEELGTQHDIFAGERRGEDASEKLGFTLQT